MSVHTKTRHTRRVSASKSKARARIKTKRSTPWREVFKEELDKYGEAALMLRGSRHKLELTQKELADALGIPQNHISEMESGKRPIGKVMALRLGKFFKTDYRKFL
jgi:ribosome-binding protein aMBF1 (putative translation factor)